MAKNKRYKRLAKRMKGICINTNLCEYKCPYFKKCTSIEFRMHRYPDYEDIRHLEKCLKGVVLND
ncbi:hypothetical protein E6V23_07950 [Clostridium perfringens]